MLLNATIGGEFLEICSSPMLTLTYITLLQIAHNLSVMICTVSFFTKPDTLWD